MACTYIWSIPSPPVIFFWPFQGGSFRLFVFHVCHAFLSVPCSLVVSCWERADLLTLLYVMFFSVTFSYGVLGQVWYLIIWASTHENMSSGLRTKKAQISLRIRAVWSAPYWEGSYLDMLRAKFRFSKSSLQLSRHVWISLCRKPWRQVFLLIFAFFPALNPPQSKHVESTSILRDKVLVICRSEACCMSYRIPHLKWQTLDPWFKQNTSATHEPTTNQECHIYNNMTDSLTFSR